MSRMFLRILRRLRQKTGNCMEITIICTFLLFFFLHIKSSLSSCCSFITQVRGLSHHDGDRPSPSFYSFHQGLKIWKGMLWLNERFPAGSEYLETKGRAFTESGRARSGGRRWTSADHHSPVIREPRSAWRRVRGTGKAHLGIFPALSLWG